MILWPGLFRNVHEIPEELAWIMPDLVYRTGAGKMFEQIARLRIPNIKHHGKQKR